MLGYASVEHKIKSCDFQFSIILKLHPRIRVLGIKASERELETGGEREYLNMQHAELAMRCISGGKAEAKPSGGWRARQFHRLSRATRQRNGFGYVSTMLRINRVLNENKANPVGIRSLTN